MHSRVSRLVSRVQRDAIGAAIARALSAFAVEIPQTLPDWADANFYLSPESSGVQGPWETQPPQRGLMLVICNDDVKQVTVRKCARIGYTKILMATVAYYTGHIPRNGVLYQPTDGDSDDFVQTEIDPMIRDCPKVAERMHNPEKRGKGNTLELKKLDSNTWHFRGGKAAAAYRRLTKDLVIYDELDGFDRDIEGTGDPVTLGDKRVTASPFKKSIRGSTPEDAGTSIIQATLDTARLVFAWHFRCVHCAELVEFKWAHLLWDDRDSEPYATCSKCGGIWNYRDLRELNAGGRWQTSAPDGAELELHYIDNATGDFRDSSGMLIDAPAHVGFTMWSGWSAFITWRELRDEFLDAKASPLKLKGFVNTRLGECWQEGDKPDWAHLHARRSHFDRKELEAAVGVVTYGVDVQDDRFEWQLTGWSSGEVSHSLGYGRLFVKTDTPEAFSRLYDALNRQVQIGDRGIMPAAICIDSGHRAEDVYRICRRNPRVWIPVKGSSDARAPYVNFPRTKGKRTGVYLTMLGVNLVKSLLYSRFLLTEGEGVYHWPVADDHSETYFQQLVSEEKRVKYVKGHPHVEWWKPAGVGNEVLDTNVYAYCAMRIAVDYLGAELEPRAAPDEVPAARKPADNWLTTKDNRPWLRGR
jgi:terminase, large subunit